MSTKGMADRIAKAKGWHSDEELPSRERQQKRAHSVNPPNEQLDSSLNAIIELAVQKARVDHLTSERSAVQLATVYLRRALDRLLTRMGNAP